MSFVGSPEIIQENDTIILYLGFDRMLSTKVKRGETFQTKYGALKFDDLIGQRFGTKITCKLGYLYVLAPTAELWTQTLPHRTQILYSTDISFILLQLEIRPGSIVVEAGTGSGSMSHALIRAVHPTGRLYTFDFHEARANQARQEFKDHKVDSWVSAAHGDVCKDGFPLPEGVKANAAFLDLPAPWEAIPKVKSVLQWGARVCSFSPCLEQVQRASETFRQHGFEDLQTFECLSRHFDIKTIRMNDQTSQEKSEISFKSIVPYAQIPGHTGFLTFATLNPL